MQISDAVSGTVLDTETVSSFTNGVYLDWKVSGNLLITITRQAGTNGVLNGVFLDAATGGASPSLIASLPHGERVTPISMIGAAPAGSPQVTASSIDSARSPGGESTTERRVVEIATGGSAVNRLPAPVAAVLGSLPDDLDASEPIGGTPVHDLALQQLVDHASKWPTSRRTRP